MAASTAESTGIAEEVASRSRNRLLATLAALDPSLAEEIEHVDLPLGTVLVEANEAPAYAYFPETAVVSLITVMNDGTEIESATVGNEGVVGLAALLSGTPTGNQRAVAQVPGRGFRVPSPALALALRAEIVRAYCLQYAAALFYQVTQTSACNRLHTMEQRCARWLLMTHDRAGADTFLLTQRYLAIMLGVRRATVNAASGVLQRERLIQWRRGRMTVLDRAGLEAASCECYMAIRRVYERELPWSATAEDGGPSPTE